MEEQGLLEGCTTGEHTTITTKMIIRCSSMILWRTPLLEEGQEEAETYLVVLYKINLLEKATMCKTFFSIMKNLS